MGSSVIGNDSKKVWLRLGVPESVDFFPRKEAVFLFITLCESFTLNMGHTAGYIKVVKKNNNKKCPLT